MRAVLQESPGDESTLFVGTTHIPECKDDEILIKVCTTALNQMDLLQCKGLYPVPEGASKIIGVEIAGTVAKVGGNCSSKFKVGDRCLALLNGGGYAEYAAANECLVMLAPSDLSMSTLAAIPEQWITAYQLLFMVAGLKHGESVLIHAGSSGVGQAAIQLATRNGIKCFATCRGDDKVLCCKSMGAIDAFNIRDSADSFGEVIKAANNGQGVDVVLDPVGATYVGQNIECLARDGRWVIYGLLGGKGVSDPAFLGKLLAKRINILPSTLRSRDYDYKQKLVQAIETEVLPRISSGEYKINIDSEFDMTTEGTQEAHRRMGSYLNIGKIVLKVTSE
jgi:tumor protein p53-inducible protein 3